MWEGIHMAIDYQNPNVVYFSANGAMPNNTSGGSMYKGDYSEAI